MPETFNPIITHLYSGQGGTSNEVTKYNNSTISEINVVDNGVTTKYDFGKKTDISVIGNVVKNTIKQPIQSVNFYGNTVRRLLSDNTTYEAVSSDNAEVNVLGLNVLDCADIFEITTSSYGNSLSAANRDRLLSTLKRLKKSGVQNVFYSLKASIQTPSGQTNFGQFRLYAGGTSLKNVSVGTSFSLDFNIDSVTSVPFYGPNDGTECTFSEASFNVSDASVDGKYYAYNQSQNVELSSLNLYDTTMVIPNTAVSGSDGTITSNNQRSVSDFINVEGASYISMNYGASYAFYNSEKTYISGESKSLSTFRSYSVPTGAKFIRFDNINATISGQDIMVVLGQYSSSTLPAYVPYNGIARLNSVNTVKDSVELNSDGTGVYTKRIGCANMRVGVNGWTRYDNTSIFYATISDRAYPNQNVLTAKYAYEERTASSTDWQNLSDKCMCCSIEDDKIYIRDDNYLSGSTFTDSLREDFVYYELATPIVTQMTGEDVSNILNGAYTNAPYTTILTNNTSSIEQSADITLWEQR